MFLKKTYLDKSDTHGIGLFAGENIQRGEVIWTPSEIFTLHISEKEFEKLNPSDQDTIRHYGYFHKDMKTWHFGSDNSRFINHSLNPTIIRTNKGDGVQALVSISKGSELTQNYRDFEELRDFSNKKAPNES